MIISYLRFLYRISGNIVILSEIGNLFRRYQRAMVLGAAIGIIVLYIAPIDQIVYAFTFPDIRLVALQVAILQIAANSQIPPATKIRLISHLDDVQVRVTEHLDDVKYRILVRLPPGT